MLTLKRSTMEYSMSKIYYGPRQQIMSDVSTFEVVRQSPDMWAIWHTPTNPPKHIVFILDKEISLVDFKPRPDRHIALPNQDKVPTYVNNWAKKHKDKVTLVKALNPSRDQLFQVMINGKIGVRFTPEAANMLLDLRPRGLQSLYWPIEQLKDLKLPEPITTDSMMGQWPVAHEVDIYNLFRSLGSVDAIKLADKVREDKVWGGLEMLSHLCKSRPIYLQYLELVQEAINDKQIRSKSALSLFTRACFFHREGICVSEVW